METSLFLAKLLGPYCVIASAGIMLNFKTYQKVMEDFSKSPALVCFGGVIAFLFGLPVVLLHNVWAAHWAVIITLFGWLSLVKGAWLLILPDTAAKITGIVRKNTIGLTVKVSILLILGVFLTMKGYFTA